MFSNCIFALSLIDHNEKEYTPIIDRSLERILSGIATQFFPSQLPLEFGAFYNGWANYTLKKYINSELFESSKYKEKFITAHKRLSYNLIKLQSDSIQLIETYPNSIWPADNIVCISSLPKEQFELKKKWLNLIQKKSTNELKLINHDHTNSSIARGSSQSLILYFLKELSEELSIESNEIFKENYQDRILGINFIKEFEMDGEQDVDSGPIILGYGSVATIMNIKTQSKYALKEHTTWNFLNLLGLPINLFGRKSYLFKKELMFDIFMLWAATSLK